MKIKDIVAAIEAIAPPVLQEDYDNAGLITGSPDTEVTGALLCLDSTEAVIDEAIAKGYNLIISHHPIVFKGLKKITGRNYVERTIIKAIQNNIAIYAAHTNLDNVLANGVNEKIASKLGLHDLSILQPRPNTLSKLIIYTPESASEAVKNALFEAGAGRIGHYSECSFSVNGQGTFKPGAGANPSSGKEGTRSTEAEIRTEVILPREIAGAAIAAAKKAHPYEEMAYDLIPLDNTHQGIGSGVIGELSAPLSPSDFLNHLKKAMNLVVIRYTAFNKNISKVAVCGGSGSFLTEAAKRSGADAYVTADIKYHEFFDADNRLMLCDIGHYESEIHTLEIFSDVIREKFPNFAVIFCREVTNPVHYFK